MRRPIIRCARCHEDIRCRWFDGPYWEFEHVCRLPITIAELKARGLEILNTTRPARLISPIKNQTINRIKAPGAAVSSSEKRAQTRANSGVAKNPSKQKRRFLAKKNQPNNQTSH